MADSALVNKVYIYLSECELMIPNKYVLVLWSARINANTDPLTN